MNKLAKYIGMGAVAALVLSSCSGDKLDTVPTDSMSGSTLLENATNALIPLNGIYRSMRTGGWSTGGNSAQAEGWLAHVLAAEVMADDMVMGASGSGWYWYDCTYGVKHRYTNNYWRPYDVWKASYTWIANANYIIAAEETMTGATSDVNYAIGQAYAIRAMALHHAAQWYARTLVGHENEPCVPIYTEPTFTTTTGKARSTNAEVYAQINQDIDKAISLLEGHAQEDKTHINYAVALGLKARICLDENDWQGAADAATKAIAASGCRILPAADFRGMNDASKANVMWGASIISDQTSKYWSVFSHLDTTISYAMRAPKRISKPLYDHMGANDGRRTWWNTNSAYNNDNSYTQQKFLYTTTWMADYVWMRIEEMYLIAAEAYCHAGNDAQARQMLMALMSNRDSEYTCERYSGNRLGVLTSERTGSLLDEILLQRRIELWGEAGRVMDIKRLRQGFRRTTDDGWPSSALLNARPTDNPENYMWVMTIPQAEFDGNVNMDASTDQNPTGDE